MIHSFRIQNAFLLLFAAFLAMACTASGNGDNSKKPEPAKEMAYWYQGKAELTSYHLEQARYGQIREGHAVLIFVTEDFNTSKQVKSDISGAAGTQTVLKMNATKKFNTGIYPYSIMTSVFTPINGSDYPNALKVTTSTQEWCGHTFMQLNLQKGQYKVAHQSYFESEGDVELKVEAKWLEDDIWNIIRLNPDNLPQGKIDIFPSTEFLRLRHKPSEAQTAEASTEKMGEQRIFHLKYDSGRALHITFENEPPFRILEWQEVGMSGFGDNAKPLVTKATLNKQIMLDYWQRNNVSDSTYRTMLGLP